MTDNKETPKSKAKPMNNRYHIVSNAKEIMDEYFKGSRFKRLSDMYEYMGEYSGVSPSTISQMRLKGLPPSYIVGIKIAELIGVEPTVLWSVEETGEQTERPICVIEGCGRVSASRGLCMKHSYLVRNLHEGRRVQDHRFRNKFQK